MIFRAELAQLVVKGRKTQTRRVANGKPSRYEIGHDYAVQPGRGKSQICRVTILDRRVERLGDLCYEDAVAEGFRSRADFARYWLRLHAIDKRRHDPAGLSSDEVLALWQARHGATRVWVITFALTRPLVLRVADRPVYLQRAGAGAGTTTDARRKMAGEPEVLGDVAVGSIARARHDAKLAREQRLQQLHRLFERARGALDDAVAFGGVSDADVAELERLVREFEAKLRAA
jgi:ASCH domain